MNGSAALVRAMRGPILLIAIGTLFAVDHMGAYRFHQTWPILVILIGVMKLAEHVAERRQSTPAEGSAQ